MPGCKIHPPVLLSLYFLTWAGAAFPVAVRLQNRVPLWLTPKTTTLRGMQVPGQELGFGSQSWLCRLPLSDLGRPGNTGGLDESPPASQDGCDTLGIKMLRIALHRSSATASHLHASERFLSPGPFLSCPRANNSRLAPSPGGTDEGQNVRAAIRIKGAVATLAPATSCQPAGAPVGTAGAQREDTLAAGRGLTLELL